MWPLSGSGRWVKEKHVQLEAERERKTMKRQQLLPKSKIGAASWTRFGSNTELKECYSGVDMLLLLLQSKYNLNPSF